MLDKQAESGVALPPTEPPERLKKVAECLAERARENQLWEKSLELSGGVRESVVRQIEYALDDLLMPPAEISMTELIGGIILAGAEGSWTAVEIKEAFQRIHGDGYSLKTVMAKYDPDLEPE